jgi:hypothetical protein
MVRIPYYVVGAWGNAPAFVDNWGVAPGTHGHAIS